MHTEKIFWVGNRAVVIRSSGHVYIAEKNDYDIGIDLSAKLVATSSAGCAGLAVAFTKAAEYLRNRKPNTTQGINVLDVIKT